MSRTSFGQRSSTPSQPPNPNTLGATPDKLGKGSDPSSFDLQEEGSDPDAFEEVVDASGIGDNRLDGVDDASVCMLFNSLFDRLAGGPPTPSSADGERNSHQ